MNDENVEVWKITAISKNHEVSNIGRVRNVPRKWVPVRKILSTQLFRGYPSITINGMSRRVHRLVCEAFLGPSNGLHINHKNGIKTDNRIDNLEYVTQRQNNRHAFENGLINNSGEKHGLSKLTNIQTSVIKEAIINGHKGISIAKYFNVSKSTISMIKHGNRWQSTH